MISICRTGDGFHPGLFNQLNNLNKEALIIIVSSLQDQLNSVHAQLDTANAQLADTNRQIELLTEQIRIMNQRQFGRHSESGLIEGQITPENS